MFGFSLVVEADSRSRGSFDRIRHWLSYCVEHDTQCTVENPSVVPQRLLRLGSDSSMVWLSDTRELAKPPKYACLSYCWGPDTAGVLTTTHDNMDEHFRGIPTGRLPQTIIDAIKVCHELDIPNIWIDSLCIIQGDKDDFAMEGSKMDAIYGNSYLTIYANEPSSCKQGFLGTQGYGSEQWQRLAPRPAPNGMEFFVRPEEDAESEDDVRGESSRQTAALDTRGWCLQESILPKRQLIYHGTEMAWRCNGRYVCECGHVLSRDYRKYLRRHRESPLKPDRILQMDSEPGHAQTSAPSFDHVEQWRSLVADYSRRSLTQPTDKLVAIQGLAKRILDMAEHFTSVRDKYHAGLWESKLIGELCWVAALEQPEGTALRHHRLDINVPTWSWASLHGPVAWHTSMFGLIWSVDDDVRGVKLRADARVDEVRCDPSHSEYPMGPVRGGYVVLIAAIVPLILAMPDETLREKRWETRRPIRALVRGAGPEIADIVLDIEQSVPTLHHDSPWARLLG